MENNCNNCRFDENGLCKYLSICAHERQWQPKIKVFFENEKEVVEFFNSAVVGAVNDVFKNTKENNLRILYEKGYLKMNAEEEAYLKAKEIISLVKEGFFGIDPVTNSSSHKKYLPESKEEIQRDLNILIKAIEYLESKHEDRI